VQKSSREKYAITIYLGLEIMTAKQEDITLKTCNFLLFNFNRGMDLLFNETVFE
jgi:hypothetical protein